MAQKKNTAALVKEIAIPVADQLGLRLWDVEFQKEGPDWHLRIVIDKDGGVGIEDCEKMSRAVDPIIDELDPSDHPYYLIVTSPGLGRVLKTDEHLERYIENMISIRLIRPDENGERNHKGRLTAYDADTVILDGEKIIKRKETASIKAADEDWEEI